MNNRPAEKGLVHGAPEVSVIVTAYNPELRSFGKNLSSYVNQVAQVVICDNSDNASVQQQVRDEVLKFANAVYLPMGGNIGIAAAQNRGVDYAIAHGYEYFIEIDQDSSLPQGYVEKIAQSHARLVQDGERVAGIGPIAVRADGFVYDGHGKTTQVVVVDKTLSSGFFFSRKAYEEVGPKDEALFIDYVDWEWCWRARYRGMKVYVDPGSAITHMLGNGHRKILGFQVGLPAPIRHYYQYRNGFYMLKRRYVPLSWRMKRLVIMLAKMPLYAFWVGDGQARRKYIWKALSDVIAGKDGKLSW